MGSLKTIYFFVFLDAVLCSICTVYFADYITQILSKPTPFDLLTPKMARPRFPATSYRFGMSLTI